MEWSLFCHVVNRAKRLHDMIERLDVDPLKLARLRQGEAYAEARDTCLKCHDAQSCVGWHSWPINILIWNRRSRPAGLPA